MGRIGRVAACAFVLAIACPNGAAAAGILSVERVAPPGDGPVAPWTLVEYEVRLDRSFANPFDPRQIAVDGVFLHDPPGNWKQAVSMPGFWFQDFEASLDGQGREMLAPVGDPAFRVRFRSAVAGTWTVSFQATEGADVVQVDGPPLTVEGADVPSPLVRRDPDDPRAFRRAGQPFVPFGANVCWPGVGGTKDIERWYDAMEAAGLTWSRLWMTHVGGLALEWKDGEDDGAYGGIGTCNLKAAWRVDRILALAEARGIAVQLVLQQHSQFQCSQWSSWDYNPWNAANGGPCATSMEFFTNGDVVDGFDRRLRYLVGRYAGSPGLMAWELWNEVDLIQGYEAGTVADWSHGRVERLRALDGYEHLVTTSYALPAFEDQDWGYAGYDFAQLHDYIADYWTALPLFAPQLRACDKPVVLGEFGIDTQGVENLKDADGTHLVNATILAVLSGFDGGAMSWWWDNWMEPKGLFATIGKVASSLGALGVEDVTGPHDDVAASGDEAVVAYAGRTPDGAIAWLHDTGSEWNRPADWVAATRTGVTVVLGGVAFPGTSCRGRLEACLPWSGCAQLYETGAVDDAPDGGATFVAPPFERDLMVRVRCTGPVPPDVPPEATGDLPGDVAEGGQDGGRDDAAASRETIPASDDGTPADEAPLPEPVTPKSHGCSARF